MVWLKRVWVVSKAGYGEGSVTDGGGLWAAGWGWLTVEVGPVGRGPKPEGCS